jgi:hypothetical protein
MGLRPVDCRGSTIDASISTSPVLLTFAVVNRITPALRGAKTPSVGPENGV